MTERMTVEDLADLGRRYLGAELQASSAPCLHRYRGIVREREVARRQREWIKLRTELEQAVALDSPLGIKTPG
jgi:hypothetical protein